MKLIAVEGNTQKLDGGAMFGNVPKALWSRWVDVDENNSISLATRALLVIFDDGFKVLFETGVGAFFPPDLRRRYGIEQEQHILLQSLDKFGLCDADIDVVVLSHLHFDHAGGLLSAWQQDVSPSLLFPNALFYVSQSQWRRALAPHPRDKASFIPELTRLLEASGRLRLVEEHQREILQGRVRVQFSDGHTPGLMLSEIAHKDGPVLFVSDLIPGAPWVHLPVTMGYDRYPETLIDEKTQLLEDLQRRKGYLFFTHDPTVRCARVELDAKGRYTAGTGDSSPLMAVL